MLSCYIIAIAEDVTSSGCLYVLYIKCEVLNTYFNNYKCSVLCYHYRFTDKYTV